MKVFSFNKALWLVSVMVLGFQSFAYAQEESRLDAYNKLRKVIGTVEKYYVDELTLNEIVDKAINTDDVLEVRKFYIQNKNKIDDYLRLSSEIFNYVMDSGIVRDRAKILRLSNIIYQMNIVVDKEIQFFNFISTLGMK